MEKSKKWSCHGHRFFPFSFFPFLFLLIFGRGKNSKMAGILYFSRKRNLSLRQRHKGRFFGFFAKMNCPFSLAARQDNFFLMIKVT
jgi:hypothetical protein